MKRLLPLLSILLILTPCAHSQTLPVTAPAAAPAPLDTPTFPDPPRLATTAKELAAIKAAPDYEKVRASAVAAADALLAKPLEIPVGYGGWVFDYACPDDGVGLTMLSPTQHQCPRCKKIYSDEKIVSAYRAFGHNNVNYAAGTLGWAYAYTGDVKYANEVKRVLLQLAKDYPSFPDRRDRWGHTGIFAPLGGRRYVQSLDEAYGVILLAKGYDLTRSSPAWSADEKKTVEDEFFRPTAESLLTFNQDINNHQTWYNAGIIACASVLGDADMVRKVLNMRGGYRDQLKRSIGADGLWYEGTMAYHNYALQAMFEIVDAGRRLGLPLEKEPKLRMAIDGPLRAAYPNGQLPAINDSDKMSVDQFRPAFNWAFKTYGDPEFDPAKGMPVAHGSEDLTGGGLAVLRQGEGDNATCIFMDYGPHGGGHGHYDKLQLLLYANGREWLLDPGRLDYSQPEYKTWVKETAAHNTVTIGGASQQATTGKLLFLQEGKSYAACAAQSDGAYPGSLLTRRLLLTQNYLVDIFDVTTPTPIQIDWFAHSAASLLQPVTPSTPPMTTVPFESGKSAGYQHFIGASGYKTIGDSRWDFFDDATKPDSARLRLWLTGDPSETLATANGIGYTVTQRPLVLIRRRTAAQTRFITVYDLSGKATFIKAVAPLKGNKLGVTLTTAEGNFRIEFEPTAATAKKVK